MQTRPSKLWQHTQTGHKTLSVRGHNVWKHCLCICLKCFQLVYGIHGNRGCPSHNDGRIMVILRGNGLLFKVNISKVRHCGRRMAPRAFNADQAGPHISQPISHRLIQQPNQKIQCCRYDLSCRERERERERAQKKARKQEECEK